MPKVCGIKAFIERLCWEAKDRASRDEDLLRAETWAWISQAQHLWR